MPRKKHRYGLYEATGLRPPGLMEELVAELRTDREFGQPQIDEQTFPTGAISIRVIWDDWERVPQRLRTESILSAYQEVEGEEFRKRITLAIGLTVPEAHAAGLLPFRILAALRRDDPVSEDACRKAMIDLGASTLLDEQRPQLRFATLLQAEAAAKQLVQKLPGSESVWIVEQDMIAAEDWWPEDILGS
jgi:hypothetical protein